MTDDTDNTLPPDEIAFVPQDTGNPTQQPENVVSFSDWREGKQKENKNPHEAQQQGWPQHNPQRSEQTRLPATPSLLRRYIISLEDGDVHVEGVIGLTNSFLAIGDELGNIKFAAAAGMWHYVTDVTGDKRYDKEFAQSDEEDTSTED